MDIQRKSSAKKKFIKRAAYIVVILLVIGGVTLGLSRLKPAAQSVDAATVWPDTVKRGDMILQVRGLGTLEPIDIRWIPAMTSARVEKIILRAGAQVKPDTVIMELSDPVAEQALADADFQLKAAEATYEEMKVSLQSLKLTQKVNVAQANSDSTSAGLEAEQDRLLQKEGILPEITARKAELSADALRAKKAAVDEQLEMYDDDIKAQLATQQAKVEGAKELYSLKKSQVDALHVKAGIDGVIQQVPVEEGANVSPGTNLARVSNPNKLKAVLKITETQAKDVQIGQVADVDIRNGLPPIPGRVIRKDSAAENGTVSVDCSLDVGTLPRGAVPEMSVEGTVTLDNLTDIVYVGRPVHGQENSTVGLFKISEDGKTAERVQVKLGKASVNTIQVLDGLKPGDKVILSDTSAFDSSDRIRLS
ncbi:MAG TPA: HlyD family efflux transporter periplasmic adaptor subunit [Blastocatellia bacterium]